MCRFLIISSLTLLSFCLNSQNQSLIYINNYKHIAISEMNRTGIPASIKMAQALLESGAGKSTLAQKANNHFGIKCGKSWDGKTFYREDDDYNEKGELIKSCFRKFKNPESSYVAHSNFLTSQKRYAALFTLNIRDYHGWANGLKDAGYATDKRYPDKLIDLIDKYDLTNLDDGSSILQYTNEDNSKEEISDPIADVVVLEESQTKRKSKRKSRSKKRSRSSTKRSKSSSTFHVVAANQSIEEISRLYNIKENTIRLRNRLPKDAQPLIGEKVYLRKKISLLRRPKFIRVKESSLASNEYIF